MLGDASNSKLVINFWTCIVHIFTPGNKAQIFFTIIKLILIPVIDTKTLFGISENDMVKKLLSFTRITIRIKAYIVSPVFIFRIEKKLLHSRVILYWSWHITAPNYSLKN